MTHETKCDCVYCRIFAELPDKMDTQDHMSLLMAILFAYPRNDIKEQLEFIELFTINAAAHAFTRFGKAASEAASHVKH